jgi:hypothetical protein
MKNRDTRSAERALALRVVKAWLHLWKVYKTDDPSVPRRWADGKLHKKVGDAWVIVSEVETDEKPNMFGEKKLDIDGISKKIGACKPIAIEQDDKTKQALLHFYDEPAGWRKSIIDWATRIVPDTIQDSKGKKIFFNRTSVRNIISHGKGPLKILTIPHIIDLMKNAVLYHIEDRPNKQGNPERFYNYTHPIIFETKPWLISIVIKEDINGNRFYDDEFVRKIEEKDELTYNSPGPSTRGNLAHPPSALNILRNILSVKDK